MKTLIIIVFLISTCLSRTIDSLGVFPFGSDFDLRKNLTIEDVIIKFGRPDSIYPVKKNLYIYYPNMIVYLFSGRLYSIEIIKGEFQTLEIGMPKKDIERKYRSTTIIKTFPNNEEIREFGFYDQNWVRYIVTLDIRGNKLTKIMIRREDSWL